MCSCSGCDVTYQVGGEWEQLGPEEQRGGQEAGDQQDGGQAGPGLAPSHLQSVRADNHPVPVTRDRHDGQRGHEDGNTREDLHHPAREEHLRQGPGHVEPVHHCKGDGESDHDVRYCEVKYENVPRCPCLFVATTKITTILSMCVTAHLRKAPTTPRLPEREMMMRTV